MEFQTKSSISTSPPLINLSLEESVTELNQELGINPENTTARQALYETMQQILHKDAFLAYQGETNIFYKIRTQAEFEFIHPKDRTTPEIFPHKENYPSKAATKLLGWSLIGLIPAGVGTMVFAPLAMISAIKLMRQKGPDMDHRRAWVILLCSSALWLIGLFLFSILVLHLV